MEQGEFVGQKYKIINKLGDGGTASVYLAENIILGNKWAIKAIRRETAGLANELQEIHILKTLSHPMLPRVADLFEDEQSIYIVMDYIKGETLGDIISREGPMKETRVIDLAIQLCDVLSYLHGQKPSPVIYRDLKPSNIMLDENDRLHLIDFGTARTFKEEKQDDTVYIGTYGYAAPEQFGSGRSDERTDLYNLGMTLIHLVTGVHPASMGQDLLLQVLRNKGVSKGFSSVLADLIQSDPDKRMKNTGECLNRLKALGKEPDGKPGDVNNLKRMKLAVAFMGIERGVGTTLAALSMAMIFSKKGYKTAYLELNDSGDMERLEKALYQATWIPADRGQSFVAEGITFYKAIREITEVPRKVFDILILDFGCSYQEKVFHEFNRADIRLMVCSGMDWKLEKIRDYRNAYSTMDLHEEWIYLISPSLPTEEKLIQKKLQIKNVVAFPLIQHLFKCDRHELKRIESTLEKALELAGIRDVIRK